MMINIAFIIDTIESPTAGTEKQLLLLIKELDRGLFNPVLCVLRKSSWLEKEFGLCPVHCLDIDSFKEPKAYLNIWRFSGFLRRNKIGILQTHFRDSNIAGVLAAKLAGTQVVVSTRRNQGYWHTKGELKILKFLNRWTDLFIANSESTKVWAQGAEGIPPEKIDVIHNGIELEPFRDAKRHARGLRIELGIKDADPVAGIVANLRPVKGIDVFLKAAGIVKASVPEARFLVIGDGLERDRLKLLSSGLGLDGSVMFLGKRQDIPRLLGAFDAGVLTSHSESFSNSVVEYLAAGLPVVCTDVGGCREAVEDGVNGFVVKPGEPALIAEKLIRIFKGGMVEAMSLESRKKAERLFSISRMMQRYGEVYLRAAGQGNGPVKARVACS